MAHRKQFGDKSGGGLSPATRITQEIIARLEAGTKPWIQPWRGVPVSRPLRACGTPYRGMNVFWLWMVADLCGYSSPYWMTYKQAKSLGAQVRKGEKSTIAIFYKSYTKVVEAPDTGEKSDEARRVLKAYPVFNADQVEGLPERYHPAALLDLVEPEDLRTCAVAAFPSLCPHDGWRGREDRILLRNKFADFGVSVYGGLVAVWITERDDGAYWDAEWRTARSPRAQRWLNQIAPRFGVLFGDYDCLGHMSNGEGVYRRRAA